MKKTVLITGTSSGLGRLASKYFAQKGWNVAATMRSPEKEVELHVIPNIKVFRLDVTQPETISETLKKVRDAFGNIDVLVNNAGIGIYGALEVTKETDINHQFEVNVKGVINVIRHILPYFRKQKSGKIINISSVMGRSTALPLGSLYNMSKFALEGLTEGLFFELKPLNIDLHLVEPGGFQSNFGDNMTFSMDKTIKDYNVITRNVHKQLLKAQKPGAISSPEKIIHVVYKLAVGKNKAFRTVVGTDAKIVLLLRKLLPIKIFLNLLGNRFIK